MAKPIPGGPKGKQPWPRRMGRASPELTAMALTRYMSWVVFVACAFFAVSAHAYDLFGDWEAVGAGIYGALIGLAIAIATAKRVPYPFSVRFALALVFVASSARSYRWIFAREVGQYFT